MTQAKTTNEESGNVIPEVLEVIDAFVKQLEQQNHLVNSKKPSEEDDTPF